MKKTDNLIRNGIIALFVIYLFLRFREDIITGLDNMFFSVTGKNLLGRNLPIRIVVFGGAGILAVAAIVGLIKLMLKNQKIGAVVVWIVILGGFVMLARMCAVMVLRRDDLWEVREAQRYGFWGVQKYDFLTYNGRYFSWFLKAFYNIFDPVPYIDIMLLVCLILTFGGLTDLIHTLLKQLNADSPWTTAAGIAFSALAAFIMLCSNVWEVWFWGAGTFIYGYGVALTLWIAALTARVLAYPDRRQPFVKGLAVFCVFCACGCSELVTASVGIFLFVLFVTLWIKNKRPHPFVTVLLVTACVCVLVILLFSGTVGLAMKRRNYDSEAEHGLMEIIRNLPESFNYIVHVIWSFIKIHWWFLALFAAVCFLCGFSVPLTKGQRIAMLGAIVLLIVTAHVSMLVNAIAKFTPPRVIGVPICWVTLACGAAAFLLGGLIPRGRADVSIALVCALCGLCFLCDFYGESFETMRTLRSAWMERDAELQALSGTEGVVTTCSLPVPGSSVLDIPPDDIDGYSGNMAAYYGLEALRADEKCPAFR